MKRITIFLSLIFALAIALSVSIPTLAAESGTTTVKGSLGQKIDVTAPSDIEGLVLDPASSPVTSTATAGTVKANKDGWTVTVTGDHTSMYSTTLADGLDAPFQVDIGNVVGYENIGDSPTITGDKTGGTGVPIPLTISQAVSWDDEAADDYQIVITFTGSYTP